MFRDVIDWLRAAATVALCVALAFGYEAALDWATGFQTDAPHHHAAPVAHAGHRMPLIHGHRPEPVAVRRQVGRVGVGRQSRT